MEKVFTNLTTGGPISVYVEDGKITRVRPLQVPEEDYPKPWTVEDRNGKKYSPPKAMRVAQNILAEKNRLYSEDRILYPMKRVDWDRTESVIRRTVVFPVTSVSHGMRQQRSSQKRSTALHRVMRTAFLTDIRSQLSPVPTITGESSATRWPRSDVSSQC